jgi:hypothetical protein
MTRRTHCQLLPVNGCEEVQAGVTRAGRIRWIEGEPAPLGRASPPLCSPPEQEVASSNLAGQGLSEATAKRVR